MTRSTPPPFALSLSKGVSFMCFDRLSTNGVGVGSNKD